MTVQCALLKFYTILGYSTETVLLIFPFLQTNITVQTRALALMTSMWRGGRRQGENMHARIHTPKGSRNWCNTTHITCSFVFSACARMLCEVKFVFVGVFFFTFVLIIKNCTRNEHGPHRKTSWTLHPIATEPKCQLMLAKSPQSEHKKLELSLRYFLS